MQISETLRDLRKEKNFTQRNLADLLGITQDSISLWEKGKRIPDTQYIIPLCEIFEVSADYLLGRSDDFGNVSVQNAAPALSEEETELVRLYRTMSSAQRARFLAYGDGLLGVEYSESAKKRHV